MAILELVVFPPFPTAAHDGLIPFKDFQPCGYRRITTDDGQEIELDSFASLPTINIRPDAAKGQTQKERKRRKHAGQSTDASGRIVPWWEEWEAGEISRTTACDPVELALNKDSLFDRVYDAADNFRTGRTWPPISSGVRTSWDHFRLYIGLLSSLPIYRKPKNQKGSANMLCEGDGDGGGGDPSDDEDAPKAKQIYSNTIHDPLEQVTKLVVPSQEEMISKHRLLEAFLEDTEKSVKVFLSSYMRNKGLVWSDRNLVIAPRVLHFFLRFMLRNGTLAGFETHTENLKRAIAVAKIAIIELPLTAKIARILPGTFDVACRVCWGSKGNLSMYISGTLDSSSPDGCITPDTPASSTAIGAFEDALKADHVEIVSSDVVLDSATAREVLDDHFGSDDAVDVAPLLPVDDPWAAAVTAGQMDTASSWTDPNISSLFALLGPTRLPLTHATGIVEFSTRRIKKIMLPDTTAIATIDVHSSLGLSSTAIAVEQELESRFARVVMEPWVRTPTDELVDIVKPIITPSSRGAVVEHFFAEAPDDDDDDDDLSKFNPCRDDLTVLVDRAFVDYFHIGLGLCGTWVQIARCEDVDRDVRTDDGGDDGDDGGDDGDARVTRHPRDCCWYLEDVVSIFPSFYAESEVEIDLGQGSGDEDEDV